MEDAITDDQVRRKPPPSGIQVDEEQASSDHDRDDFDANASLSTPNRYGSRFKMSARNSHAGTVPT